MRVLILGGTKAVGPAAARHLRDAHTVAVAHTGADAHPEVADLVLRVDEPDPQLALAECVEWLQADVANAAHG